MAAWETVAFLVLLAGYMGYSVWARLDARYPVAAALGLLVAAAVVDAAGASGPANVLAEFVFYLLGAGVLLLLVERGRAPREAAGPGDAPPRAPPDPVPSAPADGDGPPRSEEVPGTTEDPGSLPRAPSSGA